MFVDWLGVEYICAAQNTGDLRLVQNRISSSSYTRGRLEIYYSGRWGTVCDDFWSSANTRVACRQLGLPTARTSWTTSSAGGWGACTLYCYGQCFGQQLQFDIMKTKFFLCSYGSATGTIWLDNVRCSGSESRLTSCQTNSLGSHDCWHSQDVAIDCSYTGNPTIN